MIYDDGTVSVTEGSQTVTGSGTLWRTVVRQGDLFYIPGDGVRYEIAKMVSDTEITLAAEYGGTSDTGLSYSITNDFAVFTNVPYPAPVNIAKASIVGRACKELDTFLKALDDRIALLESPYILAQDATATPGITTVLLSSLPDALIVQDATMTPSVDSVSLGLITSDSNAYTSDSNVVRSDGSLV
jgi:hypothetical protein